jgi:hypothetical protein
MLSSAVLGDLLGVLSRPLVLLGHTFGISALGVYGRGEIMLGASGAFTVLLLGVSIAALTKSEIPAKSFATLLLIDGLAQFPSLLSSSVEGWYTISRTGLFVGPQIIVGLRALSHPHFAEHLCCLRPVLAFYALCLRHMSHNCRGGMSVFLHGSSAVLLLFAIVPASLRRQLARLLEALGKMMSHACSVMYIYFHYILLPWLLSLQGIFQKVLCHPMVVLFQATVINPLFRAVSPWLLPLVTGALAASNAVAIASYIKSASHSWDGVSLCVGQVFCGGAAAVSTAILALHAFSRLRALAGYPLLDPLASSSLSTFLWACSKIVSSPLHAFKRVLRCDFVGRVWQIFVEFAQQSLGFATSHPLAAIPLVLLANGGLFALFYISDTGLSVQAYTIDLAVTLLNKLSGNIAKMQGRSLDEIADSTFVVVVCALVQVATLTTYHHLSLPVITYPHIFSLLSPATTSRHHLSSLAQVATYSAGERILFSVQAAAARGSAGESLTLDELNDLAGAMSDPRQCRRCGFG